MCPCSSQGIMTTHVLYILKSNISNLPVLLFRLWQPASIHHIPCSTVPAQMSFIFNVSLFQLGNHNNSCIIILECDILNWPVPLFRLWQPASIYIIPCSTISSPSEFYFQSVNVPGYQVGNHNKSYIIHT